MRSDLGTTNQAQVDSNYVYDVMLVEIDSDEPIYVHTGIGTITYDGNDYLGVGNLGAIGEIRETEALGPAPLDLTLRCERGWPIDQALDSAKIYDVVTIYGGYRQEDGTLYDAPYIAWKGYFEYASIKRGDDNQATYRCQHDLSWLEEKNGSRYTDERQQANYSGDLGLEYITSMDGIRITWAGGRVPLGSGGGGGDPTSRPPRRLN